MSNKTDLDTEIQPNGGRSKRGLPGNFDSSPGSYEGLRLADRGSTMGW